ncbi:MAG: excinuclease ABC subunit UvrA, partial [Paludibacteraceae bacterium]|nr:excinuclease ABC subunit UvrA [Paludibacteraceae bacterium]
ACPECQGFGKVVGIDENIVVPNKSLSVFDDAVACWRGEVMGEWKNEVIMSAEKSGFPIHRPYFKLTDEERRMLWDGTPYFHGINDFFKFVQNNQYKIQYRVMLARYRGKTVCPVCGGTRLRKEASYVKVGGRSITELVSLPVTELKVFFASLKLSKSEAETAKRLLVEINNRLQFLIDVGLGYLTLDRLSNSLSGGESQRINLATSLGSSLVGSLYILDEPSIGLHPRDTGRLIKVLRQLQQLGNTVVVVEHDEEIMRAADYIIDIGPFAGRNGGQVVYAGNMSDITPMKAAASQSFTLKYLTGQEKVETPKSRRRWSNYIEVKGACENNLKCVDVKFPLNVLTVVTGVSGSGKSSLVCDEFYNVLKRYYGGVVDRPVASGTLSGSMRLASDVEFVDQNPIGHSSRSNPVTYLKAYDEIRKLFAEQQLSKQMNFTAAHFSFNVDGGRCEECQGEGTVTIEMQFMADLVLPCESCHGQRFRPEILEVKYRDKNIYDVLEMTVNQAIEFFSEDLGNPICRKIVQKLRPLQDVGIGYIKLGQSSSTLSGGESQRVKLAYFISSEGKDSTVFIFDEPTTGLHVHDVKTLMKAFDCLLEKGHTVIVIEHNLDVIKCADHIIDMGPEGGKEGGNVVFEGTPEDLLKCKESYTARFLKDKMSE